MKTRQPLGLAIYLCFQDFTRPVSVVFFEIQLQIFQVDFCNLKDGQTSIDGHLVLVHGQTTAPASCLTFHTILFTFVELTQYTHTHKISQLANIDINQM